jgi:hypothetical protein
VKSRRARRVCAALRDLSERRKLAASARAPARDGPRASHRRTVAVLTPTREATDSRPTCATNARSAALSTRHRADRPPSEHARAQLPQRWTHQRADQYRSSHGPRNAPPARSPPSTLGGGCVPLRVALRRSPECRCRHRRSAARCLRCAGAPPCASPAPPEWPRTRPWRAHSPRKKGTSCPSAPPPHRRCE